jgi:RNA polymerase sigma-70 factor (subfamily 1)
MTKEATISDETLLARGREGDEEAFRELFARYEAPLCVELVRGIPVYLRRKVSASDLAQEARMVVVQRAGEFEDRGPGSFRKWLFGIAMMKRREMLRRHIGTAKRDAGREVTRGKRIDTALQVGPHPSPSEHAIAEETAARARAAFLELTPEHQEVLRLVRDEGLSLREVGARMERSREAAKKLYARAALRFAELFEKGNGDA